MLYQAFTPMSGRAAGSVSQSASGRRDNSAQGAEPAASSKALASGRIARVSKDTRRVLPRAGDEVGGFRLVVELGRGHSCAYSLRRR